MKLPNQDKIRDAIIGGGVEVQDEKVKVIDPDTGEVLLEGTIDEAEDGTIMKIITKHGVLTLS